MANRIVSVHAGIYGMGIYAIMLPSSGFSVAHCSTIKHVSHVICHVFATLTPYLIHNLVRHAIFIYVYIVKYGKIDGIYHYLLSIMNNINEYM